AARDDLLVLDPDHHDLRPDRADDLPLPPQHHLLVDAVLPHLLPVSEEGKLSAAGLLGRGMSFPPRVGADGRIAWSDGEQNIREAIQVVLKTELNERLRLPEFGAGLGRFLFEPHTTSTRHVLQDRITRALVAWEPRITVEQVEVEEDPDDG